MKEDLKNNLMMIGYLRDRILKYFCDIEDDNISVDATNKVILDKIADEIQDFIKRVNSISDIYDYAGIPFKMRDVSGKVITREFTKQELKNMYELWSEDCGTFETQFEMYIYKYAITQKSASIAHSYNSKSPDHPITKEDLCDILGMTVFNDIQQFTYHHSFLKRLVYSTVPGITIKRTIDSLLVDYVPQSTNGAKLKRRLLQTTGLCESARGFFNPFSSDDTSTEFEEDEEDQNKQHQLTKRDIKKISLWNTNRLPNVVYDNGKMIAGAYFITGDIIEKCPIKYMGEDDLYSKNIRDNVFPIDITKGIYAFPLGNALCYRTSYEADKDGNIEYEYDKNTDCLVFKALKKIKRGDELILQVYDDYMNELKPHQLKYNSDVEYYTKNIKLI
jgi:hypothetical protein